MENYIFYVPTRIEDGDALPFCQKDENEREFVYHMFFALYDRFDLIRQPPYKRLYWELIDYLYRTTIESSTPENIEENQEFFWRRIRPRSTPMLPVYFPEDRINAYLAHRQLVWQEHKK